ncbi:hypothetical protein [Alkalimarinus alittae]|uniref:VWA domain-containing protein n=1 Tax=Alkalimarinus alittae TaxID=2961619 RepID=A0ABY6MY95_9ALTE|nr:hypothetical protein [Alkalimarinus alittae]UZE94799.1 hypothetical protein NKI27_11995 [Alkalimarinus alittae]
MGAAELLVSQWQTSWDDALNLWSRYTKIRSPKLCKTHVEASKEGLSESFAMIRLQDQTVVVDLEAIAKYQLQDYAVEVLAHEIGHHILSPATITDHAKMISRMHVNLPTLENKAGMVANLYSDLLINNHLKRQFGLRMDEVYQKLNNGPTHSRVWKLYMRVYENLWLLKPGSLGGICDSDAMEGDAWLGARIIKVYASDWLKGASRFAALLLPYLVDEREGDDQIAKLMDTKHAGDGQFPSGLISKDLGEDDNVHPSNDPELVGESNGNDTDADSEWPIEIENPEQGYGQFREPFEYGEILKSAGLNLSDHDIAVRYYKERSVPLLVPFPSKRLPSKADLVPEGTTLWEPGEPVENIDWFSSMSMSSVVIPGVTTVQREWGESEGSEPDTEPCDLDLYVDCSGSMPNPQQHISYTALAGAILCLSALRAGSAVQVTLWSGVHQFKTTNGFIRNEKEILQVLTDYFGGGTAFPIHILRKTHIEKRRERHSHVVILSDDGVTTLFNQDEKGNYGWDIAKQALDNAKGGGTMVLNLNWNYADNSPPKWYAKDGALLKRAEKEQGWSVFPVSSWEEMTNFAQAFSRKHYQSAESV